MTSRMSSKTCYTQLYFDFLYVRSLLLRRDTIMVSAKLLYDAPWTVQNFNTTFIMNVHSIDWRCQVPLKQAWAQITDRATEKQ